MPTDLRLGDVAPRSTARQRTAVGRRAELARHHVGMSEQRVPPKVPVGAEADHGSTDPPDYSLRAALLALGLGVVWIAYSRWRRRRPADLW